MNPPQVYMCSPSWTLLPPPSPFHPSGSSQCTSPKHPESCIEPGLATRFIHDILHVSICMRWPKYWSFSFSIILSKDSPGLISFRMDWLDLLAGQGTLKSLLQHHSSKAAMLLHSAFFTVQLSHPYMTTGKTIALTRRTFVGKVMSLACMINSVEVLWHNFSV